MFTMRKEERMSYRRLTVTLDPGEADALTRLAQRDRRDPKRQVQWLIYQAAAEAGLLENESGDGTAQRSTAVTRSSPQTAAA